MMILFFFLSQVVVGAGDGEFVAKHEAAVLMVVVVETLDTKNNAGFLALTSALKMKVY